MARTLERWDKMLARLQERLGLSQEELARILGVSSRNLSRWLSGEIGNPGESHFQNLLAIEEIVGEAGKALKPDKIALWFRTPNPALADLRPLDLLASRSGQARVKSLLGQVRWGIPT
ncbi:MAG: antitoxin Xre/MbcA/ParS toxin-binding domain-containing protein [Elusimicrobiota bacterium]